MSEIITNAHMKSGASLQLLAQTEAPKGRVHQLIEESAFFGDLDQDEIEMLAVWVSAYSAPTGTLVLREGDAQNCLCIIVSGLVNIFKEVGDDKHVKVAEIANGASIGEMGVIDGQPMSASAVAAEPSTVLIMTGADFDNLLLKNSNLGVKILRKLARIISLRLRATTGRLADLLVKE